VSPVVFLSGVHKVFDKMSISVFVFVRFLTTPTGLKYHKIIDITALNNVKHYRVENTLYCNGFF
jgi:hypothetical protein